MSTTTRKTPARLRRDLAQAHRRHAQAVQLARAAADAVGATALHLAAVQAELLERLTTTDTTTTRTP